MPVIFFLALPAESPGSASLFTGPPPIFMRTAVSSAIVSLLALLISISLLAGRIAEADQWFSHTGFRAYTAGKILTNLIISVLYSVLLIPFFVLALYFEALPLSGAVSAALYLFEIFLSYAFLMDILVLVLSGYPGIRRIIIWAVFCFHLLLTARIAPAANTVIRLTELNNNLELAASKGSIVSFLKSGAFPLTILVPLYLILVFLKTRRRDKDG
jgi:hypothetical protein